MKMRGESLLKRLFWLFRVNFCISCLAVGGGYMIIPLFRDYFIDKGKVFGREELTEMTAVAQSVPGAIAINLAGLAGYATAGIAGAVVGCVAAVLPPLIILSVVAAGYKELIANPELNAALKGMTACMGAIMADVVWDMGENLIREKQSGCIVAGAVLFVVSFVFDADAFLLIFMTLGLYIAASRIRRAENVGSSV